LFAAPQLLVACRLNPTPLTSTARYVLVLFPVFVVLALLFLGFLTTMFLRNTFVA
jgi:hypothetical protein